MNHKVRNRTLAKAPYSLPAFRRFARTLSLETGEPFVVEPFQSRMLADHFAGTVETVIVIPTGNGKTTLLAALGLFHLKIWPEAEVIIVASSRDQARVLFRQAAGLVRRSGLEAEFGIRSGYGEIRLGGDRNGPRIRVLAADVATGDGVIPTLVLVDELHRHASEDMYGVVRDKVFKRDGRMVTISTAGYRQDSPLGQLRLRAHELPEFTRDEAVRYNYARTPGGSFVWHEWCLTEADDVDDMAVVKLANPLKAQAITKLQERHASPTTTSGQWLRFACGIWTEGEEPWLESADWDALMIPGMTIPEGAEVSVGVDIGVKHDSTGIAIVSKAGSRLLAIAKVIVPPPNGSVSLEAVEDELRRIAQTYRVQVIAYDPWSFRRSAEILAAEGLPVEEFPQSPERMSQAYGNIYRLVSSGELAHNGDPTLRAHVFAGVVRQTDRGSRIVKDARHPRPIDALMALQMAAQKVTEVAPDREPLVAWV